MLEIGICEDEQADRERLQEMLHTILNKFDIEHQITCYDSGEKLLDSGRFHLVFMDIVMEGRNGIDIGQELYNRNQMTKIIYQTNFREYCMDAMNAVHAFAFLEKPLTMETVEQQVEEFMKYYLREEVKLTFRNVSYEQNGVEASKPVVVLAVNDILYFEYIKAKKKIRIVTKSTMYEYPGIISELAENQRHNGFETSCRGILVNLNNVMKIRGYEVVLRNGASVPLSQKRVTEFKERLNEYVHNEE